MTREKRRGREFFREHVRLCKLGIACDGEVVRSEEHDSCYACRRRLEKRLKPPKGPIGAGYCATEDAKRRTK
jgi:hypothetical protein